MTGFRKYVLGVSLSMLAAASTIAQNSSYTLVQCDLGQSIQKAVNNTRDGGLVVVTGTCSGQDTITIDNEGVTLDGGGTAVIEALGSSQIFHIENVDRVVISGFTLRGGWPIYVSRGASVRVFGNVLEQIVDQGITIDRGSHGHIVNNDISGSGAFAGIYIAKDSNADISTNKIAVTNGAGIVIDGNSSVSLGGNEIGKNNTNVGVSVNSGSVLVFEGLPNTIWFNGLGLFCETTGIIVVGQAQVFSNNVVDASAGSLCYVRNGGGLAFPLPSGLQP